MEMTLIALAVLTHAVDTAPLTLLGINYLLFTENGEREEWITCFYGEEEQSSRFLERWRGKTGLVYFLLLFEV